ncbi:MAG TPA: DNA polymerase III subunit gamma/tau [Patescibacteria group bacterium]|nr:DNA polymerase III subunit gamma/tau [Patescibacteria group bacterium]
MVFYRKYRSQTIAELDSPKLRETLYAVLSQKEIPHAFLFTGPKGLGKTSTARIIAKVLNCTATKRDGIEPCNTCDQCVSITNGNNIDVLEIDGASNRGIDEIRDLREKVNLAPSSAKKKVYIIDEVHMLTTEAFNALLKTIEEPPSHVVFIFATTEPQKVPATIISRCFHVRLAKATKEELVHALNRIVKGEKLSIEPGVLDAIAEMGDGGYRDATKILEELVALSQGKKITQELFESLFKTAHITSFVQKFLQHVAKKNAKEALAVLQALSDEGTDVKLFLYQVLVALHEEFLQLASKADSDSFFSLTDLQLLLPLLEDAYQETKYAVIASLPLELVVVQYCSSSVVPGDQATPESQEKSLSQDDNSKKSGLTMQDMLKKEQIIKVNQVLHPVKPEEKKKAESTHVQENLPKDVKDASVLMENLIYKVKPYNHSVAGVLRGCAIASRTDESIVFATAYAFHKEKLEEQKIKEILQQVVREVTGKNLKVMVELKK